MPRALMLRRTAIATVGCVWPGSAADADCTAAAMFTICPKCALTLVVTAADLRVAQGYVRCGRCSSVFNALARLTDERQAAAASGEPDPASAAEPGPAAAEAAGAQPPHEPAGGTAETSAVA